MENAAIVQQAIDFIEDNLQEHLELEEIAGSAAISLPHLYRLFYALTGHPIKEYIRKRRTSEAAAALRDTSMPVADIGYRCGFDSYRAFHNSFKRYTGLTPGAYRNSGLYYNFGRIGLPVEDTLHTTCRSAGVGPEVKLLQAESLSGWGLLYAGKQAIGLEREALACFRKRLAEHGWDERGLRVFGWNVDLDRDEDAYGYQLVAVRAKSESGNLEPGGSGLERVEVKGGQYATVQITDASDDAGILHAWNRLYSQWLPRSVFEPGASGFMEEYELDGDRIVRMKLYLSVKRSLSARSIAIEQRPPLTIMSFQGQGDGCMDHVEETSTAWLKRSGLIGRPDLRVYMRSEEGLSAVEGHASVYEVGIALPEGYRIPREERSSISTLAGGSYACVTTAAYGSMTGVLSDLHDWLASAAGFELDSERTWFAEYGADEGGGLDRGMRSGSIQVKCCVPIRTRS
ncbi:MULTISPECIES: AraC family transcriptional regulator [Paenibacillus]|uniref:Helix-turn-helix domain-containing protein n=1 Tax=Paenibacillus campinasensis TaxID=66347 RepID=A0ABW9T4K9_9BACL|nr:MULTISPECIES: AraC family transcriptional regulator [Paenibacillus]MUG67617.1 helix-turn-helix domain-containing protein [Paenibacillus campinasensis]PAK55987.1 hypothetical protein CHH75_01660 [Paenibacillus sp. 7541]